MGPKAKGKGGKGKKKNKGDGDVENKKQSQDQAFKEAVLACRIQAVNSQIERIVEEKEKILRRNERQKERNLLLQQEQKIHIDNAVAQAKELESQLSKNDIVTKEEVEIAFHELLKEENDHKQSLKGMEEKLMELDEDKEKITIEIEKLQNYKADGRFVHATMIKLMQQEMEELDETYSEMQEGVTTSLKEAKEATEKMVKANISRRKEEATERAMDDLSHESQQEFMDNKWLLKEVKIHKRQLELSQEAVDELEASNLEIISRLFDRKLNAASTSRHAAIMPPSGSPLLQITDNDEKETRLVEWYPKHQAKGDLDNYLTESDDELQSRSYNDDIAVLHVRGTAMPIGVGTEENDHLSESASLSLWSTTRY